MLIKYFLIVVNLFKVYEDISKYLKDLILLSSFRSVLDIDQLFGMF